MRARRWWLALLAATLAGLALYAAHLGRDAQARTPRPASPPAERPVPVLVAAVEARDVPVYLDGLGTAAALYTVTVRPRVDGQLDRVLFTEGQAVHAGDALAQLDPRPFEIQLHQAEAALARDEAALRADRRTLARDAQLRPRNMVAPQDYDTALAAVEQLRATVRSDRAAVANARLQLEYARPTAPIDGITGVRLVDPGNLVHATDTTGLVVITLLDPITVLFTLPQDDLPSVQRAMAGGALPVDVYSRDGRAPLGTGHLALVDNQVVDTTATIRLKALVPNAARRIWPLQFVRARLLLETLRGARVVPAAALQRGPQGAFVYVVGHDRRAAVRVVVLDRVDGEQAVVARGLDPGETVVTDGQARLHPGALVAPEPASTPPGPAVAADDAEPAP